MANYGKILPLQTHYGNSQEYWLNANKPITVPVVFADGVTITAGGLDVSGGAIISGGSTINGGIIVPTGNVNIEDGSLDVADVANFYNGIDVSGAIVQNGKPVASPSKVEYIGLVGAVITVPALTTQTITDNFAVKAGHTYRVTVQCAITNADTVPTTFTELLLTTAPDASVQQVGLGSVINAQTASISERAFSAVFVAISDSATAHIACTNSSATEASSITLNAIAVTNAPSVLVEDLGLI